MWISLYRKIFPNDSEHLTMELREVVKDSDIFDRCDPFPIWDEAHRCELEKKIIEHYYFREIGFETVGRFIFELNTRLREIMPRYNKIWLTTQYKYNPIENYNMQEGAEDKHNGKSNAKTDETLKFLDTPQSALDNLKSGKYLTSANHNETAGEQLTENKDEHTAWRHGNIGVTSTQQLIQQERDVTIDVDMLIIKDLNDLFIGVF